jgi:hypothetical protein
VTSVYPSQYQLPELTAHLIALLERRRLAFDSWNDETEASLQEAANQMLSEAGIRFRELADDPEYWRRTTETLMTVMVPRYLRLAEPQQTLEKNGYGSWRKGDLLARVTYGAAGLLLGIIVWRTPIPDWVEPLPLLMFVAGPLLPDLQAWWARRKYAKQLTVLVEDMKSEQTDRRAYEPLGLSTEPLSDDPPQARTGQRER